MRLSLLDAKCSHSIGLGLGKSYVDEPGEKQGPEHRKHVICERWFHHNSANDVITFSLLSQMQK